MKKWIIKDRDLIYKGNIFAVERLRCAHPEKIHHHDFFIMKNPDWINIVALTEDHRFILVKQHRLGIDEHTLETPAGLVEPGEDHLAAAGRELEEETGYQPKRIFLMKKLAANPAIMNNWIYFYCAVGCTKSGSQSLDPAEDIDVILYTRDEVIQLIQKGSINHSIIITALGLYFLSSNDAELHRPYFF